MNSSGADLWCEACGRRWEMDVYGQLHCKNGEDIFPFVSDWYRWEREQVRQQVENGTYHFEDDVRLEHLVNAGVGFEPIGTVHMTHDANGFVLRGNLNNGEPFELHRTVISMYSCHIEYDFKHRGDAIDICNLTDTWFVFPLTARNCLTKIHFEGAGGFGKGCGCGAETGRGCTAGIKPSRRANAGADRGPPAEKAGFLLHRSRSWNRRGGLRLSGRALCACETRQAD